MDVRTPDGVIHSFPDGATQEQINKALKASAGKAAPAAPAAPPADPDVENYGDIYEGGVTPEQLAGLSAGDQAKLKYGAMAKRYVVDPAKTISHKFLHGISLGSFDELAGMSGATTDSLSNLFTGKEGPGFWEDAHAGAERERDALAQEQADSPVMSTLAEGTGGMFLPVGAMQQATAPVKAAGAQLLERVPLLKTMFEGAKIGGVTGAAQGTMNAEDDLWSRLSGAAEGTGMGMLTGGIIPAVGAAAGKAKDLVKGIFSTDKAQRLMAEAAAGLTQGEITQAQEMMRQAQASGHNLTMGEAAQAVTGGRASPLTNLQRVVENSSGGNERLLAEMAKRPGQARAGVERLAQEVGGGPLPRGEALQDLPDQLGQRAKDALTRATRGRTEGVSGQYRPVSDTSAPGPAQVDSMWENGDRWRDVLRRPGAADAFRQAQRTSSNKGEQPMMFGRLNPQGELELERVPTGPEIDRMKKALDKLIEPHRNQVTGKLNSDADGLVALQKDLLGLADEALPTYAQGRYAYEQLSPGVNKMAEGPIGAMAEASGTPEQKFGQQLKALLPDAPAVTDENSIRMVIRQLQGGRGTGAYRPGGGRRVLDPTARKAVGQFLSSKFDEISQAFKSQPLQQGAGTGFWAKMAGNNSQAANLRAAVEEAAGPEVARGMDNLFSVFEAQGYRPAAGSQTTFNQMVKEALSGGSVGGELAGAALTGGKSLVARVADKAVTSIASGRQAQNTAQLADLLLDPDLANQWRQLGRVDPKSAQAGRLMRNILSMLGTQGPGIGDQRFETRGKEPSKGLPGPNTPKKP